MTATFKLQPDELNESFFERLKDMFRDRPVEITVHEEDVIDYPFDNPVQVKFLEAASERVRNRDGLVYVDIDELSK